MQSPRQHRLSGATSPSDDHAAQSWVYGCQEQGEFEGAMTGDGSQGKGAAGLIVLHRHTACHHE